jgi:hypothetical protein
MAMRWLARFVGCTLAVLFTSSAAWAQDSGPGYGRGYSQAEIDQMLAPIALYPDGLLSQILMAATYPQDVYEAASWSRANAGLAGDTAVRAVEDEPWDPSVISLVAFPQVLAMMDERREWTERLGEAYIGQAGQVMDTIQELRARADAAGTLRTTEEIIVQRQGSDYVIEPPTPEVVYVPYYDPRVAYGSWWWSDYPPVYWGPWAGYAYYPRYGGMGWGYGVTLGSGFFFGAFDWPRRYVRYSNHRPWYYRGDGYRAGNRWAHDRDHRWRRDGDRWRDRDGRRDNRWRDRDRPADNRTREADRTRWRDRDGDGRRDYRDGRERREWRGSGGGSVAAPVPQATTQQGFFAPRDDARTRAVAPTYRSDRPDRGTDRARREQPAAPAGVSGLARPTDTRTYAPRVQQPPRVQQQPQVQQQPPVQQRSPRAPQQSPRIQQAPQVAPAQRPVPQHAPVHRAAPAPQASVPVETPARSQSPAPPPVEERRGGRGMTR